MTVMIRSAEPRRSATGDEAVIPAIAEDGTLFPIGKLDAHRVGQKHLAVSVFVFAGDRLLIQRRALGKYHCGGLWANTCCTHPHWGESPSDCAPRRLLEEVGLSLPLQSRSVVEYRADVGNGLIEHERVHVFRGDVDVPFDVSSYNCDEVQEVAWVTQEALRSEVAAAPERFTPWLKIYLGRWSELALQDAA
ncbi:isopentenyl-diphosphate delta-isomerase [Rhodoligotrophos appendicifer]|uniref:isopentenyl-diphosphate Delta-isomerase n=1 Tax=Rhodoligotrophos appendicifer TaxID=987056 RepID=UPI001FECF2A0|nr:NUDIX domain-containing protein [Rhodoligotrophos appendicifer]